MKVSRVGHIAYNTTDMERSLKFYCEGLGFKRKFGLDFPDRYLGEHSMHMKDKPWIVYLEICDRQFLELFYTYEGSDRSRNSDKGIGYSHLCLEVEDIQEAARELKANGIEPTSDIQYGIDDAWQMWLTDPDGNRIELMQYTPKAPHVQP